MSGGVPQAEFARMHGVSRAAITQWKKRGLLVMDGDLVDVKASNARLAKNRAGGAGKQAPEPPFISAPSLVVSRGDSPETVAANILATGGVEWTMDEAKRIKESYLALLNQLEYDTKAGLVVPVAEVAKAAGEEYARVRTRLLSIPAEQAPRIARLRTAQEVQDALHALIVEALEELTRDGAPPGR